MSSNRPGIINQSQEQNMKSPGLSDLKILLERLNKKTGTAIPEYDPIRPKGGAIRVLPFILTIIILSLLFGAYELLTGSEPYKLAEKYIRENQELQMSFGKIVECNPWVPFNFNISGGEGRVRLAFSVKGESGSTKAYITMIRKHGQWGITSAQYVDRVGAYKALMIDDKYRIQGRAGDVNDTPDKNRQFIASGHRYFKQQEYDKAISEYSKAIERNPSGYLGYYWRGMAYTKKNMDNEAVADFSKVVEVMPQNAAAHNWLGWLHSKNKRYPEAIVSLTRALEINPNNGWTYYQRGHCYLARGERTKALDDFNKGCDLGNKNSCRVLDVITKRG